MMSRHLPELNWLTAFSFKRVSGDRTTYGKTVEIEGRFRNGIVLARADLETLATNYISVVSKHPTMQDRTFFFEKSARNCEEPHV